MNIIKGLLTVHRTQEPHTGFLAVTPRGVGQIYSFIAADNYFCMRAFASVYVFVSLLVYVWAVYIAGLTFTTQLLCSLR